MAKIGFLGGTFDPPHLGHFILAQDALEGAHLDKVFFIPAAGNPLKKSGPVLSGDQRADLLSECIGNDDRFGVIRWELTQPPPSYTWKTLEHLKSRFAGDSLYWIIGSDQIPLLGKWAEPEKLFSSVEFLVLQRAGTSHSLPTIPGASLLPVPMHEVEISSSLIRERIRQGKRVDFFLPSPVLKALSIDNPYLRK